MKRWMIIVFLVLSLSLVAAYQTRLIFDKIIPPNAPIFVDNPEISKIYYGELRNDPHFFVLDRENAFNLHVNILVPDKDTSRTDFNLEIFNEGNYSLLNGSEYEWTSFYDDYLKDNYLSGPEFNLENASDGRYFIRVSNPGNWGRYALVIGEDDYFSWKEALRSLIVLPKVKHYWFGEPWIDGFENVFGYTFIFLVIVIIGVMIYGFILIDREEREKRKRKK